MNPISANGVGEAAILDSRKDLRSNWKKAEIGPGSGINGRSGVTFLLEVPKCFFPGAEDLAGYSTIQTDVL